MVAVEDQSARWLPCVHCLIERAHYEPHPAGLAEHPAQHSARVSVHHDSEVAVVPAHLEISDVTYPYLVSSSELNLTGSIGNRGMEALHRPPVVAARGHPRLNAVQLHQSGDPVLSHLHATLLKLPIHARAAVGAAAVLVHALDLRLEPLVLPHPYARRPLAPGVIT